MLRQIKVGNRLARPKTEFANVERDEPGQKYERYSRPSSAIFHETLHRCLNELNTKQSRDESIAAKFGLRSKAGNSNSNLAGNSNCDRNGAKNTSSVKWSVKRFMEKIKSLPYFSISKQFGSSWYVSKSSDESRQVREDTSSMGKGKEWYQNRKKGKRNGHFHSDHNLTRSLPSLLAPFEEEAPEWTLVIMKQPSDRIRQTSKREMEESAISQTPTIYEEPWDSEKVLSKWMEELANSEKNGKIVH